MKNFREYYTQCMKAEVPTFIRSQGSSSDQAGYKPHPRSTSAGDIVWLLAVKYASAELLDSGEVIPFKAGSGQLRRGNCHLQADVLPKLKAQLEKGGRRKVGRPARLKMDGKVVWGLYGRRHAVRLPL